MTDSALTVDCVHTVKTPGAKSFYNVGSAKNPLNRVANLYYVRAYPVGIEFVENIEESK